MANRPEKSLTQRLALIRSGRGCLKRRRKEKPFTQSWAENRAGERELEERFQRIAQSGKKNRD
jgi:hypothetical protein